MEKLAADQKFPPRTIMISDLAQERAVPIFRSCGIPEIDRLLGNGGFCSPSLVLLSGPLGIGKSMLIKSMRQGIMSVFDEDLHPDHVKYAFMVRDGRRGTSAEGIILTTCHGEKREYEHGADVALRLERGRTKSERVLTCRKNRFGPTSEARVVFELDSASAYAFRYVIPARIFKKQARAVR